MDDELAQPVAEDSVRVLALRHYGVALTSLAPLPGEYDSNWLASCESQKLVIKLLHTSRPRALVHFWTSLLQHVHASASSFPAPRTVPSLCGQDVVLLDDATGSHDCTGRFMWVLQYIEGRIYAHSSPHSPSLLRSLGRTLGDLHVALAGFSHPAAHRSNFKWSMEHCLWISPHVPAVACNHPPHRRAVIERAISEFQSLVKHAHLRRGVIHGDANDYNVLTHSETAALPEVCALLDFGDAHEGWIIADVAVAAAYAMLGHHSPLDAAVHVLCGFHERFPLQDSEICAYFPLIMARLSVSVVNSTLRQQLVPHDEYIVISQRPAWRCLDQLALISSHFACVCMHHAIGAAPPRPLSQTLVAAATSAPLSSAVFSWDDRVSHTIGEGDLDADGIAACDSFDWNSLDACASAQPQTCTLATSPPHSPAPPAAPALSIAHFASIRPAAAPAAGQIISQLGLQLPICLLATAISAPAETRVSCPRAALVRHRHGCCVMLEHAPHALTLWRGLSLPRSLVAGASLAAGDLLGHSCGGCFTVQALSHDAALGLSFPIYCRQCELEPWSFFCCDASSFFGLPSFPRQPPPSFESSLHERTLRIGGNVRLSYKQPIKMVRGSGAYLFDCTGSIYLDAYNNVPSVGHSHPTVVRAVSAQLRLLQTNTRYLHDGILAYAQELTALFPPSLSVCFFVASGSEANDLALRLARAKTNRTAVVCLNHGYHGHTQSLIDVSPYKFSGPGGEGAPCHVRVVPCPDVYRGPYKRSDPDAGLKYAECGPIKLINEGLQPCAFIAETFPSVAGQIELPHGYLSAVYSCVRSAGGLCIADEVQTGFGRLGSAFWGFEAHGVVPDIVTLGKPIGNGFPMGAVVTTREIAAAFDNGMEFFCTGGGGPAAAAAGRAVLSVLRDMNLPANAEKMGVYLKSKLNDLALRHTLIGDVRGRGLFLGLELVRDRETLQPAPDEASYVVNRLRDKGILVGTEGPHHNVIKVRPPLCFSQQDADYMVECLDAILKEDGLLHA